MAKLPTVNRCCCGCDLRTATIIVAILNAISFGLNIWGIVTSRTDDGYLTLLTFGDVPEGVTILYLVMYGIAAFFTIVGFMSACMRSLMGMKTYAFFSWIWLPIWIALQGYNVYAINQRVSDLCGTYGCAYRSYASYVTPVLGMLLQLYYVILIWSYYQQLKTEAENPAAAIAVEQPAVHMMPYPNQPYPPHQQYLQPPYAQPGVQYAQPPVYHEAVKAV
ncbi:hypothetical protein HDV00_004737 [Rhizophlyctis rosea]|nr:hypothetical protein HDV00_004737 [Rhizophlyctis rosea]